MAAALSASPWGPSRAGREAGKIQPLSAARVTHRARFLGPQGSGLPYPSPEWGRLWDPWQDVPLGRVRISGCSQTSREKPLPYAPRFLSQAVLLQGTSHSIVTSITPTHTILSAWLFLPQAPRGPQLVCSPSSLHMQAQGQPPRPRLPLLQSTRAQLGRDSQGNRHPHADPCTHQGAHWGEHRHLALHSGQSQVCMDAHAY